MVWQVIVAAKVLEAQKKAQAEGQARAQELADKVKEQNQTLLEQSIENTEAIKINAARGGPVALGDSESRIVPPPKKKAAKGGKVPIKAAVGGTVGKVIKKAGKVASGYTATELLPGIQKYNVSKAAALVIPPLPDNTKYEEQYQQFLADQEAYSPFVNRLRGGDYNSLISKLLAGGTRQTLSSKRTANPNLAPVAPINPNPIGTPGGPGYPIDTVGINPIPTLTPAQVTP